MKVYRADTGELCNVDVFPNDSVMQLKINLEQITKIAISDQILLCNQFKLNNDAPINHYLSTEEDRNIFLFNRRNLDHSTQPSPSSPMKKLEVKIPQETPFIPPPGTSPMLANFLKYKHFFTDHLEFAKAVVEVVDNRINLSKQSKSEQDIQAKALEAAAANLDLHHGQIIQAFENYKTYFTTTHNKHQILLDNFDKDLAKLREIPLHPLLQTAQLQTLINCVPEDRLIKWVKDCTTEHEQLKNRVSELDTKITLIRSEVEIEIHKTPDVDLEDIGIKLSKLGSGTGDIQLILQNFTKDFTSINEYLNTVDLDDSTLLSSFETTLANHQISLKKLVEVDYVSYQILQSITQSKSKLTSHIFDRLRKISQLQSTFRDVANKIIIFREALSREKQAFGQLLYVKYLPDAYKSAVQSEVPRRRRWGAQVTKGIGRMGDRLGEIAGDEEIRRNQWTSKLGKYIPQHVIPGLHDPIPNLRKCVRIPPLNVDLPAIDSLSKPLEDVVLFLDDKESLEKVNKLTEENNHLQQLLASAAESTANSQYQQRISDLEETLAATYKTIVELSDRPSTSTAEKKLKDSEVGLGGNAQRDKYEEIIKNLKEKNKTFEDLNNSLLQENRLLNTVKNEDLNIYDNNFISSSSTSTTIPSPRSISSSSTESQARLEELEKLNKKLVEQLTFETTEKEKAMQLLRTAKRAARIVSKETLQSIEHVKRQRLSNLIQITPSSSSPSSSISSISSSSPKLLHNTLPSDPLVLSHNVSTSLPIPSSPSRSDDMNEKIKELESKLSDLNKVVEMKDSKLKKIDRLKQKLKEYSFSNSETLKKKQYEVDECTSSLDDLKVKYEQLEKELKEKDRQVNERSGYASSLEIQMNQSEKEYQELKNKMEDTSTKIVVSNFKWNDVVLFQPNINGVYEAFNVKAPNYFLSGESLESFSAETKSKEPVLGLVVEIVEKIANTEHNPGKLKDGTKFWEITVQKL